MSGADREAPGEAWRQFCRRLEKAGDLVFNAEVAGTPIDQVEGYRYLSRLLRIALEMHMENADTDFPGFYQASHPTAKIGADNPDNLYLNASISGARRYRITGQRGSVPILSFGSKANRYAVDGTMASTGELDAADIRFEPDGSFEIIASKEKANGNWLPLADDTSMLLVRQTFLDRDNEVPATVRIEAIDAPRATPEPLTLGKLEQGFDRAVAFVEGTARTFLHWADLFKAEQLNRLATTDQTMFFKAGGDPTIHYLHGYWKLAPGEALVIETPVPDCTFWNFQLDNIWMESLDYRFHRIHVNKHSARTNADGSVTIVVAARDPGYGNWIDTAGHDHGTMLLRWTGATEHPVPQTKVVKLDG
ncbi:DUF1214 domain-containing protein [Sphingomonas histidinilytica]|jgi:hypothetical protein|uniref:DUF1214 domain-containing protein n=1 Tax=Rhizorhabdus histidinilytica TaxID=439228 RepID=A0A1T5E0B8_9SPHN|nr:DUF1214 domain-containing protein [Rhizorhabdus histidinilytica]MBO9378001.1 DUF1214 domain-containing protein [Rhizorhabdus histidinilytica]QEH80748.1 DUF1214 domain-containing protein [Sphingomonas sp. C8-2]SKB77458.1 Protein of unknown function [Rhizorhabdus histidinilytica]